MVRCYRYLVAWQLARELALGVYRVTAAFPRSERFGLVDQMRRAAVSVACNLAEGHARGSDPEFAQFLKVAAGSLAELETQAELAGALGFAGADAVRALLQQSAELSRMVGALRRRTAATRSKAASGESR